MITNAIDAATSLRESSTSQTFRYAGAISLLIVGLSIFAMLVGLFFAIPPFMFGWVLLVIILCGGALIGGALVVGFLHGMGQADKVVKVAERIADAQIAARTATPPALPYSTPAPAQENDSFRLNRGGVGEDVPRDLIHGFDPRDLNFLCRQLARGFEFTEKAMEKLELPYSHAVMGKAQANTTYTRFMELCVRAGIIVGRKPKESGALAILDPIEMMQKIKQLPQ